MKLKTLTGLTVLACLLSLDISPSVQSATATPPPLACTTNADCVKLCKKGTSFATQCVPAGVYNSTTNFCAYMAVMSNSTTPWSAGSLPTGWSTQYNPLFPIACNGTN